MNLGNAGVHVSFLRKEINESDRERGGGAPVISVRGEAEHSKLEGFFEAPGSRLTTDGCVFLVFPFMFGMTHQHAVCCLLLHFRSQSGIKMKIRPTCIDGKTLRGVSEESGARI